MDFLKDEVYTRESDWVLEKRTKCNKVHASGVYHVVGFVCIDCVSKE